MYDYRHMTPEQRLEIIELRRSRGFPIHKPPHIEQGTGWYFITAACYEHRAHFTSPDDLKALETRILGTLADESVPCAGWVVLPNHYHALIHTQSLRDVGRTIGRVHGGTSRLANLRDQTPGRQVWYKFTDRKMRSERHYWATLHYIIRNPVKHGYVQEPEDWPWSSVHELISGNGREWLRELANNYPLGEYGEGWDNFEAPH